MPSRLHPLLLHLVALLIAALWPALQAFAQQPLRLDDGAQRMQAWPVVTVLADPGKQMTIDDARAAVARFRPSHQAFATLGLRKEAMWLRVPLQVPPQSDGRWVLDIDYAVLNRVDVHVVAGGRVIQQALLGNMQPYTQRPLAS